jgi:hypothetical protein
MRKYLGSAIRVHNTSHALTKWSGNDHRFFEHHGQCAGRCAESFTVRQCSGGFLAAGAIGIVKRCYGKRRECGELDEILATIPIYISSGHSRRPIAAGKYQLVVKILRTGGGAGSREK